MSSNILECSRAGDTRFSAFNARLTVFDLYETIEHHYQFAKDFGYAKNYSTFDIMAVKGVKPKGVRIRDTVYPVDFLGDWYTLLWVVYFERKPELLKVINQYDEFTDLYKGKTTINCQADVIKRIRYEGLEKVKESLSEFINLMESDGLYPFRFSDDD